MWNFIYSIPNSKKEEKVLKYNKFEFKKEKLQLFRNIQKNAENWYCRRYIGAADADHWLVDDFCQQKSSTNQNDGKFTH